MFFIEIEMLFYYSLLKGRVRKSFMEIVGGVSFLV